MLKNILKMISISGINDRVIQSKHKLAARANKFFENIEKRSRD